MGILSIVILALMLFFAMVGKGKGVVNYKFTAEKIIFTIIFLPVFARFARGHLVSFVSLKIAGIISAVLGLIIVFLIVGYLLSLIAKVPKYEDTGGDKFMGFIAGLIKGYVFSALLIILYALSFADTALPGGITHQLKYNFVNDKIEHSIEYYRTSIYNVYRSAKSADVSGLTSKSDSYYKGEADIDLKQSGVEKNNLKGKTIIDTTVKGYIPWIRSSILPPVETEKPEEPAKEDKK